jgi:hypothetical protein
MNGIDQDILHVIFDYTYRLQYRLLSKRWCSYLDKLHVKPMSMKHVLETHVLDGYDIKQYYDQINNIGNYETTSCIINNKYVTSPEVTCDIHSHGNIFKCSIKICEYVAPANALNTNLNINTLNTGVLNVNALQVGALQVGDTLTITGNNYFNPIMHNKSLLFNAKKDYNFKNQQYISFQKIKTDPELKVTTTKTSLDDLVLFKNILLCTVTICDESFLMFIKDVLKELETINDRNCKLTFVEDMLVELEEVYSSGLNQ